MIIPLHKGEKMKIDSNKLYRGAMIAGIISILGFVAYLLTPRSLWTMMGLLGCGGVFLVISLVLFYIGTRYEDKNKTEGL